MGYLRRLFAVLVILLACASTVLAAEQPKKLAEKPAAKVTPAPALPPPLQVQVVLPTGVATSAEVAVLGTRLTRLEGDVGHLKTDVAQLKGAVAENGQKLDRILGRLETAPAKPWQIAPSSNLPGVFLLQMGFRGKAYWFWQDKNQLKVCTENRSANWVELKFGTICPWGSTPERGLYAYFEGASFQIVVPEKEMPLFDQALAELRVAR